MPRSDLMPMNHGHEQLDVLELKRAIKEENLFLKFAHGHCLTLINTLFPQSSLEETTGHLPDGATYNQIDCILAPRQFNATVNRAKSGTFSGVEINSDHDLFMMIVKLKLKKNY